MSAFYRTILKLFFSDCCPPHPPFNHPHFRITYKPNIEVQCKNNNYYIFWVYVCSVSYPACIALATYIVFCGLPYVLTFSH